MNGQLPRSLVGVDLLSYFLSKPSNALRAVSSSLGTLLDPEDDAGGADSSLFILKIVDKVAKLALHNGQGYSWG